MYTKYISGGFVCVMCVCVCDCRHSIHAEVQWQPLGVSPWPPPCSRQFLLLFASVCMKLHDLLSPPSILPRRAGVTDMCIHGGLLHGFWEVILMSMKQVFLLTEPSPQPLNDQFWNPVRSLEAGIQGIKGCWWAGIVPLAQVHTA